MVITLWKLGGIVAALTLTGSATAASPARQFDLICHGTVTGYGTTFGQTSMQPKAFVSVIRVDRGTRRFCFDDCAEIFHFKAIGGTLLEYHYDFDTADEDHRAHTFRTTSMSTAGPYPLKEDFTVNLGTGDFHRENIFNAGDRAVIHHDERYTGTCKIAPFTAIPAGKR
jgi:hypothetical protein